MEANLCASLGLPSPKTQHNHHHQTQPNFTNLFTYFTPTLPSPPFASNSLSLNPTKPESFSKSLSVSERALVGSASGGLSGAFTYVCLLPLDTVKTKLQTKGASKLYKNTLDVIVKTFQENGILGFYRGLSAVVVGSTFSSAVYFGTCEFAKSALSRLERFPSILVPPTAGAMGNIVSSTIMVPKELIMQRIQSGSTGRSWEVMFRIIEKDGLFGLYAGYSATLLRNLPTGVMSYSSFEYLKAAVLNITKKGHLEPIESVICGALAGAIAASVTTPLDVVKTRLMTHVHKESVSSVVKQILREEGWVGFSVGLGPRVVHSACFSALGYFAFETARLAILRTYLKSKELREPNDTWRREELTEKNPNVVAPS